MSSSGVSSEMSERPTVLVPIEVLKGESIPDGIPELLSEAHVVLLGYHVIPEQTAAGQARMQFEDRANQRLDEFEAMFLEAGATVEHRLVFTHAKQKTIDRMIQEHECDAVLVPSAAKEITDVLVAVRGTVGIDRITRLVGGLFASQGIRVTLTHVLRKDEDEGDAETVLEGYATRLEKLGVDADLIDWELKTGSRPIDVLVEAARSYDAVVMGESDPSLVTYVFGMGEDQVAEQFLGPVLIVKRGPQARAE